MVPRAISLFVPLAAAVAMAVGVAMGNPVPQVAVGVMQHDFRAVPMVVPGAWGVTRATLQMVPGGAMEVTFRSPSIIAIPDC